MAIAVMSLRLRRKGSQLFSGPRPRYLGGELKGTLGLLRP
jgi:hypothetical protein